MRKNSLLLIPFLLSVYLSPVLASPEPSSDQAFFQFELADNAKIDDAVRNVDEKAQLFVLTKKDQLKNSRRFNEVFVTSGSALINAKSSEPDWGDARVIAYQKAQMKAREQLLKQLYSEVASNTLRQSFRTSHLPEFTAEDLQNQNKLDSLLDKLTAFTSASLDEKMREKGVDPDQYNKAPPEKRKQMLKQVLSKTVTRASRVSLSGTLIAKAFETTDRNGNTAVSVVLMTSARMKNTLAKLRGSKGNIMPDKNRGGINIARFLATNKDNLMYQYGLKLMHDEQGYPLLLSFAQAGNACNPVDYEECVDNRSFAMIDAENDAYAHIAEAYNLSGQLKSTSTRGEEKIKEARVTAARDGQERIEETVSRILRETTELSKMTSQVKNLAGVEEVMRWTEKHPVSGREINGVVLAWHPVHEQAVRTFRKGKTPLSVNSTSVRSGTVNRGASLELLDDYDF